MLILMSRNNHKKRWPVSEQFTIVQGRTQIQQWGDVEGYWVDEAQDADEI